MMKLRAHIAGLLVAVLVLTGQSMAVARGMPLATGQMEICTGLTPVMIPVDAEGNPTGPAHICPEFSLSLMNAVAVPEVVLIAVSGRGERVSLPQGRDLAVLQVLEAEARGPPVGRA